MRILLITIYLLSSILVKSQSIFPTYEDNPVWCVEQSNFGAPFRTFIFKLGKDTIRCDLTYTTILVCPDPSSEENACSIWGYLRYEGQKIYRTTGSCSEILLYDFSLSQGDTIYRSENSSVYGIVSKVDSINYNGILRRTMTVDYPQFGNFPMLPIQRIWVEGVGDLFHPFDSPLCLDRSCEFSAQVICFSNEDGVQFGTCTELCNIPDRTTSTNNRLDEQAYLQVINNPLALQQKLEVQYRFAEVTQGTFLIVNSLGSVVYEQAASYASEEGRIILDWSPRTAGIYGLIWQNNTGQRKAVQFVVQ